MRRRQAAFDEPDGPPAAAVTGASSGIGEAFARRLAARGHDLILVARRRDLLGRLAEQLRGEHGVSAEAFPADLSLAADVDRLERRIADAGNLEMLVNNAGFGTLGTFLEADFQRQLDMIRLHVVAPVRLARAALPGMVARGRGAIVNVSSVAGFRGLPGRATYSATKAYLTTFSEALHAELSGTGVRVQALCPGFTRTGFHDAPDLQVDRSRIPKWLWMSPEDVVTASLKALRRRRVVCIPGWKNRLMAALSRSCLAGPVIRRLPHNEPTPARTGEGKAESGRAG